MNKGRIFDIQRFSIDNGPGIRTTVFLKGCPLRCLWCSNPESQNPEPQLSYTVDTCIGCGECIKVCKPMAILQDSKGKAVVDRVRCTNCGDCAAVCYPGALVMVGHDAEVDEILEVVLRDRDYYASSGGGITVSGGEPLMQPQFLQALLHAARNERLHCCVDTSGFARPEVFDYLRSVVDLWLFDYKETDPLRHYTFTRSELSTILKRLEQLHDTGADIILRCPMIPDHNTRQDHLDGIVALTRRLPNLQGVELLPYFDIWRDKLKRFGITDILPKSVKPPSPETVKSWNDYLRNRGVRLLGADGKVKSSK